MVNAMEPENQIPMTSFDTILQNRHLQMLKAAIPYIDGPNQKSIALMIGFMELERTVSVFNSPDTTVQMCSPPEDDEPRPLQLLDAIKEFCTEKEQETIDMLLNYMQIFSAYSTMFI